MPASGMVDNALVAAATAFAASVLLVLTQGWHGKHSLDHDVSGIQKFHKIPAPRIGGIALVAGILVASIWGIWENQVAIGYRQFFRLLEGNGLLMLLLAGLPAFFAGLIEDLIKKVSVKARLLATFASAFLACWLLGAYLPRINVWGVDELFRLVPFSIVVTTFLVSGVANSINIIDGFHGVAGSAAVIMLAGLGLLAWQSEDRLVTEIALTGIGATFGFLLMNYPTGRLFLGDGGAYLIGFWIAEVAVLLIVRNPEINAWQALAICSYPVIEVLYSMYRRVVIRKASVSAPDRLHLHTLIYRRLVWRLVPRNDNRPWIRNAAVACFISIWIAWVTLIAALVGDTVPAAVTIVIFEILFYMAIYTRLVRGHWCLNPAIGLGLRPDLGGGKSI